MRSVEEMAAIKTFTSWINKLVRVFFTSPISALRADANQSPGHRGESLAAEYLTKCGYRLLARNERNSGGEIDLILMHQQKSRRTIVFAEVKAWERTFGGSGEGPSDAVDLNKQTRLTRAALAYLRSHRLLKHPARFDVVEVYLNGDGKSASYEPVIRHFENAFEAVGDFQMFR